MPRSVINPILNLLEFGINPDQLADRVKLGKRFFAQEKCRYREIADIKTVSVFSRKMLFRANVLEETTLLYTRHS